MASLPVAASSLSMRCTPGVVSAHTYRWSGRIVVVVAGVVVLIGGAFRCVGHRFRRDEDFPEP